MVNFQIKLNDFTTRMWLKGRVYRVTALVRFKMSLAFISLSDKEYIFM